MRKRVTILWASAAAAAVSLSSTAAAEAATRYAEPGGNGPATSCPASDPCSIQDAAEDATVMANDVIAMLGGTYSEANKVAPLVAVSFRPEPVGAKPRLVVSMEALELPAGSAARDIYVESTAGVRTVLAVGSTLERVEIRATDPAAGGVFLSQGSVLRDSIVSTNKGGATGDTVRILPGGATLSGVTIIGSGAGSDGIVADPETMTVNVRNVIARAEDAGIRAEDDLDADNLDVNVSYSNYSSFVEVEPEGDVIFGPGTQTAAPLFMSEAMRDFHQLAGSPTINAGSPDGTIGATDFDGEARIMGSAIDIGGDEFTEAPSPATPARPKRRCRKGFRLKRVKGKKRKRCVRKRKKKRR